jgi:hypothetical protein
MLTLRGLWVLHQNQNEQRDLLKLFWKEGGVKEKDGTGNLVKIHCNTHVNITMHHAPCITIKANNKNNQITGIQEKHSTGFSN